MRDFAQSDVAGAKLRRTLLGQNLSNRPDESAQEDQQKRTSCRGSCINGGLQHSGRSQAADSGRKRVTLSLKHGRLSLPLRSRLH